MKKHIIPIIFIIASIVMGVVAYPHLPAEIPMQWGLDGGVNSYGSKLIALSTMSGLLIMMYVLLVLLPKVDPKKENYKRFTKTYYIIIYSTMGVLLAFQALSIFSSLHDHLDVSIAIFMLLGFLFIILGNYMQRAKQNFFLGIRTPWTLTNEEAWKKTHRLGSKLFVVAGICIIISGFLPNTLRGPIALAVIVITVFISYIASYIFFRKEMWQ